MDSIQIRGGNSIRTKIKDKVTSWVWRPKHFVSSTFRCPADRGNNHKLPNLKQSLYRIASLVTNPCMYRIVYVTNRHGILETRTHPPFWTGILPFGRIWVGQAIQSLDQNSNKGSKQRQLGSNERQVASFFFNNVVTCYTDIGFSCGY